MLLLLIVVIVSPTVASDDEQYNALHFGTSSNDYIGFTFDNDMAPFQESALGSNVYIHPPPTRCFLTTILVVLIVMRSC